VVREMVYDACCFTSDFYVWIHNHYIHR
jgi:hypothetical protein